YRHEYDPTPAHYGCSVDVINPADGELLDVFLADDRPRERAEHLTARVVDVLERKDGDDKLLAVPVDIASTSVLRSPAVAAVRDEVWRWCVALGKPVVRWGGEDAALDLIRRC